MAFYNDITTHEAGLGARFLSRASDVLAQLAERMVRNRIERVTRDELRSLPNRELADLGISPADIPFLAKEAARTASL